MAQQIFTNIHSHWDTLPEHLQKVYDKTFFFILGGLTWLPLDFPWFILRRMRTVPPFPGIPSSHLFPAHCVGAGCAEVSVWNQGDEELVGHVTESTRLLGFYSLWLSADLSWVCCAVAREIILVSFLPFVDAAALLLCAPPWGPEWLVN